MLSACAFPRALALRYDSAGFASGRLPAEVRHCHVLTQHGPQEREADQDGENGPGSEPDDLQHNGENGTRHDKPLEPSYRHEPAQERRRGQRE